MTNANKKVQAILDSARKVDFRELNQIESSSISLSRKHFVVGGILELRRLCRELNIGLKYSDETIFVYNDRHWERFEREFFISFLREYALKIGIPTTDAMHFQFLEELHTQFKSVFTALDIDDDTEMVKINLQNGTCVFSENGIYLKPYDRKDNLEYILPFKYDDNATCPEFNSYLEYVLPDLKSRYVLAEYIAYCFVRNSVLKLEKAAVLIGDGANGKSVFFEIISALFGKNNISHISLKNLTEERGIFRPELKSKLLNYASELGKYLQTDILKQLVSGEPVDARMLYKSPITISNYARLMFNTNEMPSDVEFNDGYFRRYLPIRFGVTIPESMRDPNLSKRIIDKELSGIFNWVISGLERLLKQKRFTESEKINYELEKFKNSSDSVRQFIEEESFEKCLDNPLTLKTIYKSYKDFCFEYGYKPVSVRKFADRVRNAGYESERKNYGMVIYMRKSAA